MREIVRELSGGEETRELSQLPLRILADPGVLVPGDEVALRKREPERALRERKLLRETTATRVTDLSRRLSGIPQRDRRIVPVDAAQRDGHAVGDDVNTPAVTLASPARHRSRAYASKCRDTSADRGNVCAPEIRRSGSDAGAASWHPIRVALSARVRCRRAQRQTCLRGRSARCRAVR